MKCRYKFFILMCVAVTCNYIAGSASVLTPEDYCDPKVNAPLSFKDIHPLPGGDSFAAISEDGKSIETFSFKSGAKTGTLFALDAIKGNVRIDSFEGFRISANGKKILLWKDSKKIYRNSFTADYYVYDILRSTLFQVSSGGFQRNAVLSHDGRQVAFERGNDIYISNIDYGTEIQVTTDGSANNIINGSPDWAYEEEFGMISSIRWSPDDSTVAFLRFDESEVPVYSFDEYGYYDSENPLGDMYPRQMRYKYPLAGYPNSEVGIFAYNIDNRKLKKMDLPCEGLYVPFIEFTGVNRDLLVMTVNRMQNELNVYRINADSTVPKLLLSENSKTWLSPSAYQSVKFTSGSFMMCSDRSGYRHVYEYDYNGNLLRQISRGNWNVTALYGKNPKTGTTYIQATVNGPINRNIVAVDSKGGVKTLNPRVGTESAVFSTDYQYYLSKFSDAQTPPVYSICDSKGTLLNICLDNKEYASKYESAPKPTFLKIRNTEGEDMDACMIFPKDFDKTRKYPLLMYQYNGPESQLVLNSWKIDGLNYIASEGYIIGIVDGRGTGNRSREWATCVYGQLGKYETDDQFSGAAYFKSLPYIDARKAACFGWSYGGYMSLMEMGASQCPFSAGIAMAPVTDWRFYDSVYTERYMGMPSQNESGYSAASALNRTSGLSNPLLVMSGTSDDNVHFYNTLRYTSKLTFEGKRFEMMAYSGFEHSLRMTNARTRLYGRILDFLNSVNSRWD